MLLRLTTALALLTAPALADSCNFNGSTSVARIANPAATAVPITLHSWVNVPSFATTQDFMGTFDLDGTDNFRVGVVTNSQVRMIATQGTGGLATGSATALTAATWQTAGGTADSTTSRFAWGNGTNGAVNAIAKVPATISHTSLGQNDVATPASPYTGKVHTAVIWSNIALTLNYMRAMALGWNPLRVTGFLPSAYLECIGGEVKNLMNGQTLTLTDVTFTTDGPPMAFR